MPECKMTESTLKVRKILSSNYVNDGHYSHVSLVLPRGKYCLSSRPLLEKFWKNYCTSVLEEKSIAFGIAEVPQLFIPILVDVDLKFSGDDLKHEGKHFYSEDLVHKVVTVYQHVLREMVIFEDRKIDRELALTCFWLDKEPYSSGEGVWKNGFHLHFPNLFVSKIEQETRIIPAVKKYLDDNFETVGVDSSIIDGKAVGNTWLLYGSVKAEHMKPYKVAAAYNSRAERVDLVESLKSCVVLDDSDKRIVLSDDTYEFHLPRIFSILSYGRSCFEIKKEQECMREYIYQRERPVQQKGSTRVDLNRIRKIIDLLSPKRAEGHDDWMTVGWALYNITQGSDSGLDLWIKFSKSTDDHDEDRCIYEWARMVDRQSITVGTLIYFARSDNPAGYKKFISENNTTRENYSEFGLSELFYEYCQEEFVYCNKSWYAFEGNFWKEEQEGLGVKKRMLEVIRILLDSIKREKAASASEDEDGKADQAVRSKDPTDAARSRLNTIGFVNSIMEFSKIKFLRENFTSELNSNKYLIGFRNGIYDLKAHVFRKGQPSDMISIHMKISYSVYTRDNPRIAETLQFFEKVIPNENIRRYFMDVMSEIFIGYNHRKKVYFWTGEGDNGKSIAQMFFSKMLGPLCVKAPTTLITSKRGATGSANAELARLGNGVRLVFLEEPDPTEEIYQGIFKHLSGNDDFYARDLYQSGKEVREIQPMFKMVVICNSLPSVKGGGDKATWNRVRVIPFESTFKKDAPVLPEEQMAKFIFPIDTAIDQKIPSLIEPLAWLLLEHSKEPKCEDPYEVVKATLEYQSSNDFLVHFFETYVKEDESACASKFDFYETYKEFCLICCSGKRPITFMDFVKALTKKIGPPTDGDGWKGYRLEQRVAGAPVQGAKGLL